MKKDIEIEKQRFWTDFQSIGALLERGFAAQALARIEVLGSHPRKEEFDPNRNVDYSYAVLLQQASINPDDWQISAAILQDLLEEVRSGILKGDVVTLLIELSSAMTLLKDYESAARYATESIELSGKKGHKSLGLAFQNLGRALFELGQLSEAHPNYLKMIDFGVRYKYLTLAGIGAEWLARIAIRRGNLVEAAIWHDLARETYQSEAPHHLKTFADVLERFSPASPRGSLDDLPPQAKMLREQLPDNSEVGDRAGIHLDSLNIDLGALPLLAEVPKEEEYWIRIPLLEADPQILRKFAELIMAEANAILPHALEGSVIKSIIRELWAEKADRILERLWKNDLGEWKFVLDRSAGVPVGLDWSSKSANPWLFNAELQSLALLLQAAFQSRQKTMSQMGSLADSIQLQFVNLQDRAYPRPIHLWMIIQGQAAAGGEMGPSFLAEDMTRRRLLREDDNKKGFAAMEFTPDEAEQLHKGGLVALLASELAIPGGVPPGFIGTTPLNEVSAINLPKNTSYMPDVSRPGFVLDREYNTWFWAPSPKNDDQAWYGTDNQLFRDHFSPFHSQVETSGSLRAKHYAIPIIDIHSPAELERVRGLLNEAVERLKPTNHVEPDARVWFRGQTRGYLLNRTEMVTRYLFGRPSVDEPSLPGAAPRRGWNYLKVHSFLSIMLQKLIYRQAAVKGELIEETHSRWREFATIPGAWDLGVMLLAQHYGVPTHGIDITSELDIALWFATNRFAESEDGTATYHKLHRSDWGKSPSEFPLIYAIIPVTNSLKTAIRDVDLLEPLGIDALRPRRQHAAFFMGAHGLHRNRLAEALVCVLRLAPGYWETKSTYAELFPSEYEDAAYDWMLELKFQYSTGEVGKFLSQVPSYIQ